MTLDDYLDAALARLEFPSDRQLALHLGMNSSSLSWYRTKRCWPDEARMLQIAEAAGADKFQALIDLNSWRARGAAATVYTELRQALLSHNVYSHVHQTALFATVHRLLTLPAAMAFLPFLGRKADA